MQRRRQPQIGVLLLVYQLFSVIGINNIPPVTLGSIALQVAIYLRFIPLPWRSIGDVCISSYNVLTQRQWQRVVFSAIEHADDMHLYYNMASFALKGRTLERRYGSPMFLFILVLFTVLTGGLYVAMDSAIGGRSCAVGFSAVIFALKVLTTDVGAAWSELILISLMVPNASFIGHLAGVLVGLAWKHGPIRPVVKIVTRAAAGLLQIVAGLWRIVSGSLRPADHHYARNERYNEGIYNAYVPRGMDEDEQLRRATEESLREYDQPPPYSPWADEHEQPRRATRANRDERTPPYPTTSGGYGTPPPPPGFAFDDRPPPPAGFMPDIEDLRQKRAARFDAK